MVRAMQWLYLLAALVNFVTAFYVKEMLESVMSAEMQILFLSALIGLTCWQLSHVWRRTANTA